MASPRAATAELSQTGRLQLSLLLHGVRVPVDREQTLPHGIDLLLPGDVWVRAAVRADAKHAVRWTKQGLELQGEPGEAPVPVAIPALGDFYHRTTCAGRRFDTVALIHDRHLVLPATAPGDFWRDLTRRSIGGSPAAATAASLPYALDDALEVIEAGFRGGHMDFVHLEAPNAAGDDGGLAALLPFVESIRGHFDTLISVNALAPASNAWIDAAYAAGVDALSFALGCTAADRFRAAAPPVLQRRGHARILDALRYAAQLMPSGCVCAELVVGAEDDAEALRGIEALVAVGVIPALLIPGPDDAPAVDEAAAAVLWTHAVRTVRRRNVRAPWVRHFLTAAHALDGPLLPLRRERHFGVSLAKLRRALRVQRVNESYGSSEL